MSKGLTGCTGEYKYNNVAKIANITNFLDEIWIIS